MVSQQYQFSRAFQTNDPKSLPQIITERLGAEVLEMDDRAASIDAYGGHLKLPNGALWLCAYDIRLALKFPDDDYVRVQFRRAGTGATRLGRTVVPITAATACISPAEAQIDFGAGYEQLVWRMSADFLKQKFAALTGMPARSMQFAPTLDLETSESQSVLNVLGALLREASTQGEGCNQFLLAELESALAVTLLFAGEHSLSSALRNQAPSAAPWQVYRAESFIEAHWNTPVTIEAIASATGASARSIYRAFRRTRGYTPLEFARRVRLEKARELVVSGDPAVSLTQIAQLCGFSDLSQFSKEYARGFGEPPSASRSRRAPL